MALGNGILWGAVTSWLCLDLGQRDSSLELGERVWVAGEGAARSQKGQTEQEQTVDYNALSLKRVFLWRLRIGEGLYFNRTW